jgi:hypothetical protein
VERPIEGVAALRIHGRPFRPDQPAVVGWGRPVRLQWDPLPGDALWLHVYQHGREVRCRDVTGAQAWDLTLREGPVLCQVKDPAAVPDDHSLFGEAAGAVGALVVRGVQPLAGNRLRPPGCEDGPGVSARFDEPVGLAWMGDPGASDLLVADPKEHVLRRVRPDGTTTTVLGQAGVPGAEAGRLREPTCLAVWPQGSESGADCYLLADTGNHRILLVDGKGAATVFAGADGKGHQDGPLRQARFDRPMGLAVHGTGSDADIYVADAGSFTIRRIRDDQAETVAGQAYRKGSPGGLGTGGEAVLCTDLKALAVDPSGTLVAFTDGHAVGLLDTRGGGAPALLGRVDQPGFQASVDFMGLDPARSDLDRVDTFRLDDPVALAWSGKRLLIANRGSRTLQVFHLDRWRLYTLAGDPGAPAATCDGLLRDGAEPFPGDGYATFQGPGGLVCAGGPACRSLVLADGCCLVRLEAWDFKEYASWVPRPEALALVCETPQDAGAGPAADGPRPCRMGFRINHPSVPERPYEYDYVFTCLDRHGAEVARFQGRGRFADPLLWTVPVPEPGPVTLRLALITPEGVTVVREQPATVS